MLAICCYPGIAQSQSDEDDLRGQHKTVDDTLAKKDVATADPETDTTASATPFDQLLQGHWKVESETRGLNAAPIPSRFDWYIWTFQSNHKVTTKWKRKGRTGQAENHFSLDDSSSPNHLTIYGENMLIQAIFQIDGEEMKVAHFGKSQNARPKSFDDQRTSAGPLVIQTLRRVSTTPDPNAANVTVHQQDGIVRVESRGGLSHVFSLNHIQAADVPKFVAASGINVKISVLPKTNVVIASGTKEEIAKVDSLIKTLDNVKPLKRFEVLNLRKIDPSSAALVIRKTFGEGDETLKLEIDQEKNRLLIYSNAKPSSRFATLLRDWSGW